MKILFIGDVVGKPGREAIRLLLPQLTREFGIDFVIANAENASGGSGITRKVSLELYEAGVHVLTSGDHIWKKKEILEFINDDPRIMRPANYPDAAPGRGYAIFTTETGAKIGVINVNGRVFMDPMDCPFAASMKAAQELRAQTRVIVVDVHAEATSEKTALGWYLDGKVSAVIGTHTHIQTADERILPQGTAYMTDAGMTGPYDSVIGRRVEDVLQKFITGVPVRFEVALQNVQLHAALIDIDEARGSARSIMRIQRKVTDV